MSHLSDERILELLDGDLSPDETASTAAHVAACETCRDRTEKLAAAGWAETETGRAIRATGEDEAAPAQVQERIRAVAREAVAPTARRWIPVTVAVAVAAAATLMLIPSPSSSPAAPGALSSFLLAADKADLSVRGDGSRGASASLQLHSLKDVRGAITRGELTIREARAESCIPPELYRAGAFDDQGRLRAYLRQDASGLEVHVFDDLGRRTGAARLTLPSERAEQIPPIRVEEAEEQLAHPTCPSAR